ncbi:MAG TPA: hypothetical protein VMK84_36430 [Streptosporangiaceae bacterium]|nr:hypothetical protein [Streptosporangiaceae bacterium]
MQATVLQFPSREPDTIPDPDVPVVAAYFARQGWTGHEAFLAGLPADLAAAIFVLEASCPA